MTEEDQLIDEPEVEELDVSTDEGGDLEPSPAPQYAQLAPEQLEELKRLAATPRQPSQAAQKEPEFNQEEFNRVVGYKDVSDYDVQRLSDPDVPVEERRKILASIQKNAFESSVRAVDYINQQKFKTYDHKIQEYESIQRQQRLFQEGQRIIANLYQEYPGVQSYPRLVQDAANELRESGLQFSSPKELNKWIANKVKDIGKEYHLEVDLKKKISNVEKDTAQDGWGSGGSRVSI
jgi:hypothetical protein